MSSFTKTALIITGGLVLVIIVAGGAFYWFSDIGEVDPETGERITPQDYFPIAGDGNDTSSGDTPPPEQGTGTTSTSTPSTDRDPTSGPPRLAQVSPKPVAGHTIVTQEDGTATSSALIRYITQDGQAQETAVDRADDTTLGDTETAHRARWFADGSMAILQRAEDQAVKNDLFTVTETDASTGAGGDIRRDTAEIAPAPSGDEYAFLYTAGDETSVIINAPGENSSARRVGQLPGVQWHIAWPTPSRLLLTSKPAQGMAGVAYTINPDVRPRSRAETSIEKLHDADGLTTNLNPAGNRLLFSQSTDDSLSLHVKNTQTGAVSSAPFTTLPEKCAWSELSETVIYCAVPEVRPSATYPDAWYQGRISFRDNIRRYDLTTGESRVVASLSDISQEPIDAIDLQLSPQEDYLTFINKRDRSLWSLRLSGEPTEGDADTADDDTGGGTGGGLF